MKLISATFRAMIPLLSDMTALSCLFVLFSALSGGAIVAFSLPLYFALALAVTFLNGVLLRAAVMVSRAALVLTPVGIAMLFLLFRTLSPPGGLLAHLVAAGLFLYPIPRSFHLLRHPADATAMLTYTEMSILGTASFLAIQLGVYQAPPELNLLCILALLVNLCTLSSLRISGDGRKSHTRRFSLQRAAILGAALLLLAGITALLGLLLIPASGDLIRSVASTVQSLLLGVLSLFQRLLDFLASLATVSEESFDLPPPTPGMEVSLEAVEYDTSSPLLLYLLLAGGLVSGGGLLLYLLWKHRSVRLAVPDDLGAMGGLRRFSTSLPGLLLLLLRRLLDRTGLFLLLLLRRNTCGGVFLRLEARGRRCGYPRQPGQTPRAYLDMLCRRFCPEDPEGIQAFAALSDRLDRSCYSGTPDCAAGMLQSQVRLLLRCVKREVRLPLWRVHTSIAETKNQAGGG